ncbi:hypothetical protein [Actinoallomurus rhizosphaericola]|nr:hypothetical protein [Actinoallomurus rhizosphaericola]MCO5998446.1 hypothetical protein [Actinoallomurus rhizosphaericola]
MDVHVQRNTGGAGFAGFVHCEERCPRHQVAVFDPAQQSHESLHRF